MAKLYKEIMSLHLGASFVRKYNLEPGRINVQVKGHEEDVEMKGKLIYTHVITGLSKLYESFPDLKDKNKVEVKYSKSNHLILIILPEIVQYEKPEAAQTVLDRQHAKHIHIEHYTPLLHETWMPRYETDLYMIFGSIQDLTEFKYCAGTSESLIQNLLPNYYGEQRDDGSSRAKPDAILIDRNTSQYLIAEFKIRSRDFIGNHRPDEVDVLICWEHDETNDEHLPTSVLCLKDIVAQAAREHILDISD